MRQTIVITDLTQMRESKYVCIVGINESGRAIRPVAEDREKGISEEYLWNKSQLIVRPGAKVEFDFQPVEVELPHVEDRQFDPNHIVSKGFCINTEFEHILRSGSYTKVGEIFDGLLQEYKWVEPGANTRSIATLAQPTIIDLEFSESSVKPRLYFRDKTGHTFDCAASDRALWNLCYSSVKRKKRERKELSSELLGLWQSAGSIYLRLGLARPFKITPTTKPRCYLQVTGVYTFPDYLHGKTFADF